MVLFLVMWAFSWLGASPCEDQAYQATSMSWHLDLNTELQGLSKLRKKALGSRKLLLSIPPPTAQSDLLSCSNLSARIIRSPIQL